MTEFETWLVFGTVICNLALAVLNLVRATRNSAKLDEVHETAKEAGAAADRAYTEANGVNLKIAQAIVDRDDDAAARRERAP